VGRASVLGSALLEIKIMATFSTGSFTHPSGEIMGTADKDYFLDAEGNVTTDEEAAHTLLIRKGQDIPKDMADKYALGKKGTKASAMADESAADETDTSDGGEKASSPSANKKARQPRNKGAK
jgi:hypothetical protein